MATPPILEQTAPTPSSSRPWVRPMRLLLALLLAFLVASPADAEKRIALSFDDVPRHRGAIFSPAERTERLIAGLQQANVHQAVFFVVPGQLGHDDGVGGEERIAAYVAAGHVIADHSFSHRHLSAISAADYLADIDKSEAWLKNRPGARPWFRFPFLDEGMEDKAKRDLVRAGLKARGLRNGYATIDGNDWQVESLVAEVVKTGSPIQLNAVRDFYVETMVGAANFYDGLAVKAWGRHPAHVILLHETDIAALFIADLVEPCAATAGRSSARTRLMRIRSGQCTRTSSPPMAL
ncbi:MAG: polysaccharide deacetylase family protein [Sphingomicrobium sp.]